MCRKMNSFKENQAFVLKRNTAEDVARAMIEGGRQRKPFHIFDMDEAYHRIQHFKEMMPRVQIYFALKSNNHDMFLKLAVSLGLGFDCASPGEIQKIIQLGVNPRSIIDTLPSRHPDHLEYARSAGVRHATFDTSYELQKMKQYWPDVCLLIRIRVESDSIYKLGEKFGADPEIEAFDLLDEAASLGLRVAGVAFHVGSACFTPASFDTALRHAHKLFEHEARAGRRMSIVDIGGGFLSDGIHIIDEASKIINSAIEELFPDPDVQIIAEPGRYICDTSFNLYCNINNVRKVTRDNETVNLIFLNDGVHGTLSRSEPWHTVKKFQRSSSTDDNNEVVERAHLFGPSCDYGDRIMRSHDVRLPKITPSDWLVFTFQGSYTIFFQSQFQFIEVPLIRNVMSSDLWNKINQHPIFKAGDFILNPDISSPLLSTLASLPEKPAKYLFDTPLLKL
ncbi:hypothetical protein O0L34_g17263 [Tuta absoluta]|nr:hypothetical protein O0L34_g17263 [Tuta absoluta]